MSGILETFKSDSNLVPINIGGLFLSAGLLIVAARFYFDPLSHVPGPLIARLTPGWLWYLTWKGVESSTIAALHEKYGPVVRIAPNEVDIADGAAIHPIYIKGGGFPKPFIYRHYDIEGFPTIFSEDSAAHRAPRAKAVASLFAQQALAKGRPSVQKVVDTWVAKLRQRRHVANGRPVNVLDLSRAFALDSLTSYLLHKCYNGLEEETFSAGPFVDDFAAGGRFFYIPNWILNHLGYWAAEFHPEKEVIATSIDLAKNFAARVVDASIAAGKDDETTYQGRLLGAAISRDETVSQVLDIMFAGTDSVAMTLSVLCWHLSQHPLKRERAREEMLLNPGVDPISLPYVSGIVKESLRIALATPTRLPRVVPAGGLEIPHLRKKIPAGVNVGIGAYALHRNPAVFPDPDKFVPERWLEPTSEMLRDSFAFGMGSRQCIARNLATAALRWAAECVILTGVLDGARPVRDKIEITEWFNARVPDGKIELVWD